MKQDKSFIGVNGAHKKILKTFPIISIISFCYYCFFYFFFNGFIFGHLFLKFVIGKAENQERKRKHSRSRQPPERYHPFAFAYSHRFLNGIPCAIVHRQSVVFELLPEQFAESIVCIIICILLHIHFRVAIKLISEEFFGHA